MIIVKVINQRLVQVAALPAAKQHVSSALLAGKQQQLLFARTLIQSTSKSQKVSQWWRWLDLTKFHFFRLSFV